MAEQKKETCIFYRSFYEAISSIDDKVLKLEMYEAVIEFGLNQKEPDFNNSLLKMAWILIKPQLEANQRKYENGCKPKQNTTRKKTQTKTKEIDPFAPPKEGEPTSRTINNKLYWYQDGKWYEDAYQG